MNYVVLCGNRNSAPDRIVGPFDGEATARDFSDTQPGPPERYAIVEALVPPDPTPGMRRSVSDSVAATHEDGRLDQAVAIGTSVLGCRE